MSNAIDKNAQALHALFGSAALADRLTKVRIAVVSPADMLPVSGRLLAEVLADTLARLWPNIDFFGCVADLQRAAAVSAATSGGCRGEELAARWVPPYDCVISIGCDAPAGVVNPLRVGASGWVAELGPDASCGENANPVGPAFAAALASAQVFRRVFEAELSGTGAEPMETCTFDVRTICRGPGFGEPDIDLAESHVFGVGAVTHGMMWLLERWPARVSGRMQLIDQDEYSLTNGQRYSFMRPGQEGLSKANSMKARLEAVHPALTVTAHGVDLNAYCAQRGHHHPLKRIIAGLDSAEARRHAALKLPERAINMWTEGVRIGAGRYRSGNGAACLGCEYPEDVSLPRDEVAQISIQTGLRPDLVRSLLDDARGLRADEAATVAARWSVSAELLVGQPLRSVLPVLCSMGRLQMAERNEDVDVPFSFASLFAGIAGFMMLFKDVQGGEHSEGWTQHVFKPPTSYMHSQRHVNLNCVACSELAFAQAY